MAWIREACGAEIAEAAGGDRAMETLLAAITANESGGCRQAYRFAPENHERLSALLKGAEGEVEGVTGAQLEQRLAGAPNAAEREALLKRLAGLHGYTLLPGYLSIGWGATLEELVEKTKHFRYAARRLEELCRRFGLDPARQAAEVGRSWSAGHPNGRTRSALYSWRLQERMRLYEEGGRSDRAA